MSVEICAICERVPATDRGGHIWPSWYLKHLDMKSPPVAGWSINGEPMLDRNCMQVYIKERQRIFLPACKPCNQELNRRFEGPAQPLITSLVDAGWAGLMAHDQWQAIGLWYAKVLLLLGHPRAHYADSRFDGNKKERFVGGGPDLKWLVTKSPVPKDLSLWVFNADISKDESMYSVLIPRAAPGEEGSVLNFLQVAENGLCVALLWHPGWPVTHPLVGEGAAWELLHAAPAWGDLSLLPKYSYSAVSWIMF